MGKQILAALAIVMLAIMLVGCGASNINPEGGVSFIRHSKGELGGALTRWVGLAGNGEFCQMTASDPDYVFTDDDRAKHEAYCNEDSTADLVRELIQNEG